MATYVENAILRVTDQSTATVGKIDKALTNLFNRVNGFAGKAIDIKANVSNLVTVQNHLLAIERAIGRINAAQLSLAGANNAAAAAARAQTQAQNAAARAQTATARSQARAIAMRERDLAYMGRHAVHATGVPYSVAAAGMHYMHLSEKYPTATRAIMGTSIIGGAAAHSIHAAAEADTLQQQMNAQGWDQSWRGSLLKGLAEAQKKNDKEAIEHYKHELEHAPGDNATAMGVLKAAEGALTKKYKNVSEIETREVAKDLMSIMGDAPHAMQSLESSVDFLAAMKAYGIKGDKNETMREFFSAIKSAEIAGKATTPQELQSYLDSMLSLKYTYGEQAKYTPYLQAQRAAGISLMEAGDRFRFGMFPALVQEFGSGAGVMMATAFRAVAGNKKFTQKEMGMMNRYGLLEGDRMADTRGFMNDPFKYAMMVADRIKRRDNIDTNTKEGKKEFNNRMIEVFGRMFGDRNAAKFFVEQVYQNSKLQKDADLQDAAYRKIMEKRLRGEQTSLETFEQGIGKVKAQWSNLEKNLLDGTIDKSKWVMDKASNVLNRASESAKRDPMGTALIGVGAVLAGLKAVAWGAEKFTGAAAMHQAAVHQKTSATALQTAAAALQRAAFTLSGGRIGMSAAQQAALAAGGLLPPGAASNQPGRVMRGLNAIGLGGVAAGAMKWGGRGLMAGSGLLSLWMVNDLVDILFGVNPWEKIKEAVFGKAHAASNPTASLDQRTAQQKSLDQATKNAAEEEERLRLELTALGTGNENAKKREAIEAKLTAAYERRNKAENEAAAAAARVELDRRQNFDLIAAEAGATTSDTARTKGKSIDPLNKAIAEALGGMTAGDASVLSPETQQKIEDEIDRKIQAQLDKDAADAEALAQNAALKGNPMQGALDPGELGRAIMSAGEQAATEVQDAGTDAASAIGGAGSDFERNATSAGSSFYEKVVEAAGALAAILSNIQVSVNAADNPGAPMNLGGRPAVAR